jgi:hypothetical protein
MGSFNEEKNHRTSTQQRPVGSTASGCWQVGALETELNHLEHQLKAIDREQYQLLQWALKGFPENQVEVENRRLNKAKETLKTQKAELNARLNASQQAVIDVSDLERFIETIQDKLPNLDYEGRRLALDMLNITIWLDSNNVEITGTIDPESVIVNRQY